MTEEIKIGKLYKHYKGNIYMVIGIGKHSETCEDMVLYQSVKTDEIWVRPQKMWNDYIEEAKTKRFTLLEI
jgi:hypothetical protein